jgi:catechol 2,3-dioxygenase-like lactoylglutathione lyase family enzyme
VEINGVAHVILSVSKWEECRPFYERLLTFLGLKQVFAGQDMIYFVGGRTAVGVGKCDPAYESQRFVQNSIGLHHVSFRARSREDVETLHNYLRSIDAHIVHGPEEGPWAPGYYSVLFEDPIGTRLEFNFVPGAGVLAENAGFNPAGDYH